jgi:MFS family permease
VFGRLANRTSHRRPLVVLTLGAVAVSMGAIPFLSSVPLVIAANAILWLVVAAAGPVLTMLVVEDAPAADWGTRIGLLNKFQGYGWAGGLVVGTVWPLVGTRLLPGGLVTRSLFWGFTLVAVVSTVLAVRTLPRPAPEEHVRSERAFRRIARLVAGSRRGVKTATFAFSPNQLYWATRGIHPRHLLGRVDRTLLTYFAAAGLFFVGMAAFWAPLPLFLRDTGFASGEVFLLYLVSSLGSAVLYQRAGDLATRVDLRVLQSGALTARGLFFPLVALLFALGAVPLALGAVGLVLTGIGVTWAIITVVGTAIVTRLAPVSVRGEILGVYTALGAVAGGIGGVLGGWLATVGAVFAYGVAGALVVVGAGVVFVLRVLSTSGRATADETTTAAAHAPLPPVTDAEVADSPPE